MQFDSITEFFAMGGHALYVWLAYGATIAVFLGNHFAVRGALKGEMKKLKWGAQAQD